MAVDSSSNILLTGDLQPFVDLGGGLLTSAGNTDVFVAKYDQNGAYIWADKFGSSGYEAGNYLAVDSVDNVLVTGYFEQTVNFGGTPLTSTGSQDMFLLKLTP